MYESRTSFMGHELSTIYNTRKDVHEVLPQRSRTAVYEPRTTYMSTEKYVYMSHESHVWVTNDVYEWQTIHDIQHQEGYTRGASATQPQGVAVCCSVLQCVAVCCL